MQLVCWIKEENEKQRDSTASHQSSTCLPLSEQNDQVHIHRTLADATDERKQELFLNIPTTIPHCAQDMQ